MDIRETEEKIGKSVLACILSAKKEYIDHGYHPDPNIYRVMVHKKTWESLSYLPEADLPKMTLMGFKVLIDNKRLNPGEVLFGPEQVLIIWKEFK